MTMRLRGDGATVINMAVDGRLAGLFAIADPVKASTPDALKALAAEGIKVIMLTIAEQDHEIVDAMERGVDGYVLKTSEPEQIVQAILAATQGASTFPSEIMQRMARGQLRHSLADRLSPREFEIVCQVALGLSNRGIGEALGLSENTVRNHLRNILEKLGFDNRVQVATFALENGFLKRGERATKKS